MKVVEVFASIQGEGKFIGEPTVFVRLAGCNMRCTWCDTKESWEGGEETSVDDVVKKVRSHGLDAVCITGGEPLLQADELLKLLRILRDEEYKIIIETNGSIYDIAVFNEVDHVACDMKPPSSGEKSDERILTRLRPCDYVKVVVADEGDLEYAKEMVGKSPVEVFLQPADSGKLRWLAERVLEERIPARVLPQLHKVIGVK
jgi:7-carboxy-7-deazaguanine synthase